MNSRTATTEECCLCGAPLDGDGPSDDFCSESHQRMWYCRHADPLPDDQLHALATAVAAAVVEHQRRVTAALAAMRPVFDAFIAQLQQMAAALRPLTTDPRSQQQLQREDPTHGRSDHPRGTTRPLKPALRASRAYRRGNGHRR